MDSDDQNDCAQRRLKIRQLNDALRVDGEGGRIMLTRAVADLGVDAAMRIFAAVRAFDNFTQANDPWGEHDFGQVEVDGEIYFWKIDAYDINLEFGSPDPADETVTCRVLTIMTTLDL